MKILISFFSILSIFNTLYAENEINQQAQVFLSRFEEASKLEKQISEKLLSILEFKAYFESELKNYVNTQILAHKDLKHGEQEQIYNKLKKEIEDEVGLYLIAKMNQNGHSNENDLIKNLSTSLIECDKLAVLKFACLRHIFHSIHLKLLLGQWDNSFELLVKSMTEIVSIKNGATL